MPDLSTRATHLAERMDAPDCDPVALERTYRRFAAVNALVSGWRATYRQVLRPLLSPHEMRSLLDVGCGGGDLSRALARWAAQDGLLLDVTGLDPDPRALAYATSVTPDPGVPAVRYVASAVEDLAERFDFVVSNHVLHHVDDLDGFLAATSARARVLTLHSDLDRSPAGYAGFWAATAVAWPLLRGSFIREDGLISLRRSHRPNELRARLSDDWRVVPRRPSHYLLLRVSRADATPRADAATRAGGQTRADAATRTG